MSSITQAIKLKTLYSLKALGYEYIDEIIHKNVNSTLELPDNISELSNMILQCHLCELSKTRINAIVGTSITRDIKVMFIVDPPSMVEDELNQPLSGKAMIMLEDIVTKVLKLQMQDIYITNALKCKIPTNTILNDTILSACNPYLFKQIQILKPNVIVPLGAISYNQLINSDKDFQSNRGKLLNLDNFKVLASYSPTYLLRNPSLKKQAHSDMLYVKELI